MCLKKVIHLLIKVQEDVDKDDYRSCTLSLVAEFDNFWIPGILCFDRELCWMLQKNFLKRAIGMFSDLILKQVENKSLSKSTKRIFFNPLAVLDYTNKQLFYYIAQNVSKRNTICATCNKNAE